MKELPAAGAAPAPASAGAHEIAKAMALLWTYRPRTAIFGLLPLLGSRRSDGHGFTQDDVKRALGELRERGWLEGIPNRDGYFRLTEDVRSRLYREVLDGTPVATLRDALRRLDRFGPNPLGYHWPLYDVAATVAHVRLALFSGASAKEIGQLRSLIERAHDWTGVVWSAALPAFDPLLFERIVPEWRWALAFLAVSETCLAWRAEVMPVCAWALRKLDTEREGMPESLRLALAELLVHRGEGARARHALEGIESGAADALRACLLVQAGRWSEAQLAFEASFKRRQAEVGARKRILPSSVSWMYPVVLLAQQAPRYLELARKFCLGEAGKRKPDPREGWGRWVHAISARLGDIALERQAFELRPRSAHPGIDMLWELLLAAWLGRDALGLTDAKAARRNALSETAGALREVLEQCRFDWLVTQVDAAEAVLRGDQPSAGFFVSGPREQWRDVLAALQALGAGQADNEPRAEDSRIVWAIRVGKRGAVEAIEPLEQKRGPRGWSKPKSLALAKIAGNARLPPWDAKVARSIRQDRDYSRRWEIDRAAAIMALIGHPAVVLAHAPEQLVDVVEGTPEVEVVKDGDHYLLRVTPSVRADDEPEEHFWRDSAAEREADALRMITLVQDTPQRLRVIRLTAAQRRAAQLVAGRFAVPASAHDELQHALRSLAEHFQVLADHAEARREIATESRLRAELSPIGEQLLLRLVVAPLGVDGPRVAPGIGRAQLMAAIGGETVGTRRDLAAERASLEAVLDALPMLDEPTDANAGCEWLIADPEHALAAVEALPKLAAVVAVDWPKGRPVRVLSVDTRQLAVVVKRDRDWFRLHGRAVVDESIVLDFQTLMAAAQARSRFVPIGDGIYAALTHSLKAKLADLAAVAEADRDGARVPRLAAAWLSGVLEDAQVESDGEFRAAIDRLHRAQDTSPIVPKALQAELRSYQEDGYRWAMRLASAGLGGCLADDMGLGKTLQGLAVLLARGADGAALVIAPTSVCGNWLAEARRFAPTLNVAIYGEGERERVVANAGPMDVIIVSYSLLQQGQERFAARSWHTVIADEAQAIKNAAAKRSLAVFDLPADFRLALSGTPIENRLTELWSIMRFANPGLLGTPARFGERFATPIERDRDRDAQHLLKRLIGPFVLRRTKGQVLQELPPRTELNIAVAPGAVEAAHYEALRRQAAANADHALSTEPAGQARLNILAQLTRLRRAACDPRLVSPELSIIGAKVQAFTDLASELVANGHKALVFSQFVDFLSLLRQPLDAAGIGYQYLDGSTPAAERTRRVAAFQAGEGDLFLISLKAGGFGLNLTAADYVLITDPWWNPAAEDQAMGRAHRIGQARPVTVYRLVSKGTVEERIVALHQGKRALAESILAEGDAMLVPSADDLIALIRGD
ncbi:MAG: DEAD/DEAH box helicase [Casimicrobiaceae bacterium]